MPKPDDFDDAVLLVARQLYEIYAEEFGIPSKRWADLKDSTQQAWGRTVSRWMLIARDNQHPAMMAYLRAERVLAELNGDYEPIPGAGPTPSLQEVLRAYESDSFAD